MFTHYESELLGQIEKYKPSNKYFWQAISKISIFFFFFSFWSWS